MKRHVPGPGALRIERLDGAVLMELLPLSPWRRKLVLSHATKLWALINLLRAHGALEAAMFVMAGSAA